MSRQPPQFDLSLNLSEHSQGIVGSISYSANLYRRETIERMISHFKELLNAIVTFPEDKVDNLPMMDSAEAHRLLVEFNDTAVAYRTNKTLPALFEEQVEKTPDAVAVIFGNHELSYRELNERSNQLAHYLRENGAVAETLVPICLERGFDMIVGILGILKAGGRTCQLILNTRRKGLATC
jgi:non-ribosomal peptide synthetase component F